jgi:hypothetical protein
MEPDGPMRKALTPPRLWGQSDRHNTDKKMNPDIDLKVFWQPG